MSTTQLQLLSTFILIAFLSLAVVLTNQPKEKVKKVKQGGPVVQIVTERTTDLWAKH